MPHKKLNRIIGVSLFFVALTTYWMSISPTVVFWDVGEFAAAAYSLQVPHPPGAPLFLLVARVFGMIPFVADIAVRMHFISALSSAATVMFLYLVTVRFLLMMRGKPENTPERLTLYGSAAVGALALTFSKTFWFNAIEAEVYGLSMFFVSGIMWLGLRWYERAEWSRSDVYLLLIAYMIGLSVGVHLLAILTVFIVMLLVYFRWYEFSPRSFIRFGVVAVLIFGTIYPLIIKEFPSMLDGEISGMRNDLFSFIPHIAVGGALYGIYYAIRNRKRKLNVGLLAFLFIVLGYSTYLMVYIRANAEPPMNENDPSTISRLVSYLNREQYGSQPLFERRWDPDPEKQANHQRYTSDLDYFWRFQMGHMYFRYFGWNFVGSAGDVKESGVDWTKLYGLPLLLGLFGAYTHWRKDPKMAFVNTSLFLIMGVILVVYFNMQEPQPRERDYFYVGSFFAFCVWIGIGVSGLIDLLREQLKQTEVSTPLAAGTIAVCFLLIPANMYRVNAHENDRTGNYIAWDYSYNLLQSVEKDGILFTNGDNDTFPLWYLQDVEGVRRDIRIVNLSLLNTAWYIRQLKHEEPYGAKKVPISTSDVDIERIGPIPWKARQLELPVTPEIVKQEQEAVTSTAVLDTSIVNSGVLRFTLQPTLNFGEVQALRVQDIMVYDIIRSSKWERPIYFAMTVSDEGKIGLSNHMQLRGLAFKLTPRRGPYWQNIDIPRIESHLFSEPEEPSLEPRVGFRWRGLQNPDTYFDEDSRRLVMSNYRNLFMTLAEQHMYTNKDTEKGLRVLRRMDEVIPHTVIQMDANMKYRVAMLYDEAGDRNVAETYLKEVVEELTAQKDSYLSQQLSQYNPLLVLFYSQMELGLFDEAEDLVRTFSATYGSQQGVPQALQQMQAQIALKRQEAALDTVQ